MRSSRFLLGWITLTIGCLLASDLLAQRGRPDGEGRGGRSRERRQPEGGRGGRGPGRPDLMRMIPVLAALDGDKDGEISAKEIQNAVAALKSLDKNKDGKLTREELAPSFERGGAGFGGGPWLSWIGWRTWSWESGWSWWRTI